MKLIESLGAHQLFELVAESGGIVRGGVAHVRGRLGGPIMGFAVRHGRNRWESPEGAT